MPRGTMASLMNERDIDRRKILVEIEKLTKSRVIAYLANPNASPNFIDQNDPIFINDLLECVNETETLDIIMTAQVESQMLLKDWLLCVEPIVKL